MLLVLISFNQKRFQLCINLSRVLLLMAAGAIATIESDFTEKNGKFPEKAVSFRRRDMASTGKLTAFFGNLQQKSTASDEETSCLSSFQGCGARKKRPTTAFTSPTALRPEPTCRDLPCGIWGALIADGRPIVISSRPPEPSSPSAVVADL